MSAPIVYTENTLSEMTDGGRSGLNIVFKPEGATIYRWSFQKIDTLECLHSGSKAIFKLGNHIKCPSVLIVPPDDEQFPALFVNFKLQRWDNIHNMRGQEGRTYFMTAPCGARRGVSTRAMLIKATSDFIRTTITPDRYDFSKNELLLSQSGISQDSFLWVK